MVVTKREDVTKQGFCKILWRKLLLRGDLLTTYSIFFGEVGGWRGVQVGVGAYSRLGAYSKWALIRGWTLIRINTVISTDIEIILEEFVSQFFFSVCFYNNDYTQQGLIRTPEDVLMVHQLPDRLGLEKNKTRAHVIHKRSLAPQKTLRRAMQDEKRSAGWCGVQGIFWIIKTFILLSKLESFDCWTSRVNLVNWLKAFSCLERDFARWTSFSSFF